jgi:hypothetical protein
MLPVFALAVPFSMPATASPDERDVRAEKKVVSSVMVSEDEIMQALGC